MGQGGFAVELLLGGLTVDNFFIADPGDFGPNFHGWVSDELFDTVSFTFLGADYVGFDEIAFTIPGPPAIVLLATALAATRRRRQT